MSDPVTIAIAAAVAGKVGEALTESAKAALTRLRRALRQRFAADPAAQEALATAQDDPEDPEATERLAAHVSAAEEADPAVRELVGELRGSFQATDGGVVNVFHGTAGKVVQARDIHGGLNL